MVASLDELARIRPETIHSIGNFLLNTTHSHPQQQSVTRDESEPDTEKRVDIDSMGGEDPVADSDVEQMQKQWLKHTLIIATPNLDILTIASAQKFVVLEQSKRTSLMEVAAKVRVAGEEEEDEHDNTYISAVASFGVAPDLSNASSRSLTADWFCICIGLSDGRLLFYTERGVLLFFEKCSASPLLNIRLGPSARTGNQELVVLTAESRLVVVEGPSLCAALRTARSKIAHGERLAEELSQMLQLNAQQLQLDRLAGANDVQLAGLARPSAFDQYASAFFAGGRKEMISSSQLPVYAHYICTVGSSGGGQRERGFVAFLWHNTAVNPASLTDAFLSMTSKISSNIPSFGFRSFIGVGLSRKDRPPKQWLEEAQTTSIYTKSWLRDGKRLGERTFIAPFGWHLIAVTDNVGRILLVHTERRRILRIWKGYRQARCAWLEVAGSKGRGPKSLFLVIYAPRRALLEVWSMQNGPRVSAFEVGDNGRLLAIPSSQSAILHGVEREGGDIPSNASTNAAVAFLAPNGTILSVTAPSPQLLSSTTNANS